MSQTDDRGNMGFQSTVPTNTPTTQPMSYPQAPPSPYGSPIMSQVPHQYGMPQYAQPPAKPRRIWPFVLLGVLGCFGILSLVGMFLVISALSQCVRALSDVPIRESHEVTAFISDLTANEDDLRVFDTLLPAIEESLEHSSVSDETDSVSADELRQSVADGKWEGVDSDSPHSPLLWVRLCELAERDLESKTNENWEVIDFAYPFPSNGPVPFPAHRDEESRVVTMLVCKSSSHKGLVVENDYLRWAKKPYFDDDYDETVKRYDQVEKDCATLREIVPVNDCLCLPTRGDRGYTVHVWENDNEERLSDIHKFAEVAQQMFDSVPDVFAVDTLKHGERSVLPLQVQSASDIYPIPQSLPLVDDTDVAAAQQMCRFDHRVYLNCWGDEQFEVDRNMTEDGKIQIEKVYGQRRPRTRVDTSLYSISGDGVSQDGAKRDDEFISEVAEYLGIPSEHVLVLSAFLEGTYGSYASYDYAVFVPAREANLSPERFAEVTNEINRLAIEYCRSKTTYTDSHASGSVYAIDEENLDSITIDGKGIPFADFCAEQDDHLMTEGDVQIWLVGRPFTNYDGTSGEYTRRTVTEPDLAGKYYDIL